MSWSLYLKELCIELRKTGKNKMKICLKELRESQVNLEILKEANLIEEKEIFEKVLIENSGLIAIFAASLKTTQRKM
jgi:four helix bundle protein